MRRLEKNGMTRGHYHTNDQALEAVEEQIIAKTEHIYASRVFEAIGNITGEDGKFNNIGA